ncbi:hypothetical protein [Umezawaea sp. Da 62-37]|uniref:hypothetical protein n=1 Tax=Umezawaea sp. Da 62-37 TaxID=3075927 RepID=UPI0028F74701|nr:hypothetical protein [Umezawaea sp. Da 62-37]WNV91732.1 hypothetical protein RM788_26825 [Umezawaea sp. Da 62-37]
MPGPKEFGPDGTQAPPPPRLFPDALAGLVTGEAYHRPKPVVPLLPVYRTPVQDPEIARAAIREAMLHEHRSRPVRTRQPLPPQGIVSNQRVQYHAPVAPTPQAHAPAVAVPRQAKSRGSAFGGFLVALLILGSVFFNVIRQVVESLLDAIR